MNDYLGDDKYVKKPRTKPEPEVVNRPLTQIQALGEVPGKTMGMRNGRTRAGLGGGNTRNKTKKNTRENNNNNNNTKIQYTHYY
jgi:hypothetical protein